jgi:ABC-type transport system substrate-binding protein
MSNPARKMLVALAVLGAAALGGSALAGAASKSSTTTQATTPSQSSAPQGQPPAGTAPGNGATGGHVGRNGQRETLLTGDVAAKVKAAALAKVSGGTVERVETDADHGSPYEAHVRRADGTELEVLVNKDFQVTAVNTMRHP